MKFLIAEEHCCSVTLTTEHWSHTPDASDEEKVMYRLTHAPSVWHRTEDHPEFAKLRSDLEAQGFIEVERMWWNGDRVLRPFTLNDFSFKKGDQFPCGSAFGVKIAAAKRQKKV